MWPPYTKDELQTVLGMTDYLAPYIPNLSLLNQLLHDISKQQQLKWEYQLETVFINIEESISSSLVLFDPASGSIELQVDALKFGLGAIPFQNAKPVTFTSRALNATRQN
ncbi:hypothetical protein QYM36_019857 [Artemia franciscana]|uniref:Uncharacterized protein n=1 Tax=Artemia franciscana TaxID=6661 RepID=A0AA88KSZ9_ARTSF|nr:hypothetical protein QYM36_019857 [Artemia franciscana]